MPHLLVHLRARLANSERAQFTNRFQTPSPTISIPDLQAIANAAMGPTLVQLRSHWAVEITGIHAVAQAYERVVLPGQKPYFRGTTAEVVGTVAPLTGSHVNPSSPPQVALVITHYTQGAGRRARGRVYLFPPPRDRVNGAGLYDQNVGVRNDYQAWIGAIEGAVPALNLQHIVHSVTYGDTNEVTGYGTDGRVDTQRRRVS